MKYRHVVALMLDLIAFAALFVVLWQLGVDDLWKRVGLALVLLLGIRVSVMAVLTAKGLE